MKWILTISIVVFFHGIFAQDIKVFEDSLISLLKNVQTEKNTQQAKHHNIEFKAYLEKTTLSFEFKNALETISITSLEPFPKIILSG